MDFENDGHSIVQKKYVTRTEEYLGETGSGLTTKGRIPEKRGKKCEKHG